MSKEHNNAGPKTQPDVIVSPPKTCKATTARQISEIERRLTENALNSHARSDVMNLASFRRVSNDDSQSVNVNVQADSNSKKDLLIEDSLLRDYGYSSSSDESDNENLPRAFGSQETMPSTQDNVYQSSQSFPNGSSASPLRGNGAIDNILADRNEQIKRDEELKIINTGLEADMANGGIDNIELPEDVPMDPDQQKMVKKLAGEKSCISSVHPGIEVFDDSKYCQLFTYPEILNLKNMNYIENKTDVDKSLLHASASKLLNMLSRNMIPLYFKAVSCPNALLDFLFLLASIHDNSKVLLGINNIFGELLQRDQASDWWPSAKLMARVLVNYGASISTMCPELSEAELRLDQTPLAPNNGNKKLKVRNLKYILRFITLALTKRPNNFSLEEKKRLSMMIFTTALSRHFSDRSLVYSVSSYLSALFQVINPEDKEELIQHFCQKLPLLSSHHHDKVYLAELWPPGEETRRIQRYISYKLLLSLIPDSQLNMNCNSFTCSDVLRITEQLNTMNVQDYYQLNSQLFLIDLAVGIEHPDDSEIEALKKLVDILPKTKTLIKDPINLDPSLVRDHISRMDSRWTFLLSSLGWNPSSISQWERPTKRAHVELLANQVQDEEEDACSQNSQSGAR